MKYSARLIGLILLIQIILFNTCYAVDSTALSETTMKIPPACSMSYIGTTSAGSNQYLWYVQRPTALSNTLCAGTYIFTADCYVTTYGGCGGGDCGYSASITSVKTSAKLTSATGGSGFSGSCSRTCGDGSLCLCENSNYELHFVPFYVSNTDTNFLISVTLESGGVYYCQVIGVYAHI